MPPRRLRSVEDVRAQIAQLISASLDLSRNHRGQAVGLSPAEIAVGHWVADFKEDLVVKVYRLIGLEKDWNGFWAVDSSKTPLGQVIAEKARATASQVFAEAEPELLSALARDRAKIRKAVERAYRDALQDQLHSLVEGLVASRLEEIVREEAAAVGARILAEAIEGSSAVPDPDSTSQGD